MRLKPFALIIAATTACLSLASPKLPNQDIESVVAYTLQTNPDVLISIRQREQSDTLMRQDEAAFLPVANISNEDGPENTLNQNTNYTDETLHHQIFAMNLSENVFNGFQNYFNVKSDLATIASRANEVNSTAQNTALAVGEVFLNVLRTQQLVQIAQKNVAVNVNITNMIERREQKGLSSKSEFQQARGRLALARSDLLQKSKNYQDAISEYIAVVGLPPENLIMPEVERKWQKPNSIKEAEDVAIERNPALRASKFDLNAAIETHKAAAAPFYPTLDIVASRSRGENIGGQVGANNNDSIFLEANFNLFRGGADYQRYKQTAYQEQEAFNRVQKIQRQIIQNTMLAWNAWQTSLSNLVQLNIHKVESAKVAIAFQEQYTVGKRTLVDLLNAQSEAFTSQSNYVDGQFNILLNRYRLLNSEGLLLNYFHSDLPAAATDMKDTYHQNYVARVDNNQVQVMAYPPFNNTPNYTTTKVNASPTKNTPPNNPRPKIPTKSNSINLPPKTIPQVQPTLSPNYSVSVLPAPVMNPVVNAADSAAIKSIRPTYSVTTVKKPEIKAITPTYTVTAVQLPKITHASVAATKKFIPTYTVTAVKSSEVKHTKVVAEKHPMPTYTVSSAELPMPKFTTTYSVTPAPKSKKI